MNDWQTWKTGAHILVLVGVAAFIAFSGSLIFVTIVVVAIEAISGSSVIEEHLTTMIAVLSLLLTPHPLGMLYGRMRESGEI